MKKLNPNYNGDFSINVNRLYTRDGYVKVHMYYGGLIIELVTSRGRKEIDIHKKDVLRLARLIIAQYESWNEEDNNKPI